MELGDDARKCKVICGTIDRSWAWGRGIGANFDPCRLSFMTDLPVRVNRRAYCETLFAVGAKRTMIFDGCQSDVCSSFDADEGEVERDGSSGKPEST